MSRPEDVRSRGRYATNRRSSQGALRDLPFQGALRDGPTLRPRVLRDPSLWNTTPTA
jgi:hypothetical protein